MPEDAIAIVTDSQSITLPEEALPEGARSVPVDLVCAVEESGTPSPKHSAADGAGDWSANGEKTSVQDSSLPSHVVVRP